MRPLEVLATAKAVSPRNFFSAERTGQGGFELIFAEAQRRESTRTAETGGTRNESRPAPNDNRTESLHGERTRTRRRTTAPTDDEMQCAAQQAQLLAGEAAPDVSETGEAAPSVPDAEIIETVAEILDIPPEMLLTMLEQLDLQPQDLQDPQQVTRLLQLVFEAESPVELLNDPEFPAAYKGVNEALAQMMQSVETSGTANNAALEAGVMQTAEAATTVPVVEGLQYAEQDGELMVTDMPLDVEETTVQTTRSTATSTSSDATGTTAPDEPRLAAPETAPLLHAEAAAPADPNAISADPLANMIMNRTAAQTAQQVQTAQPVNPADVIDQIMNQIRVHAGEQVTEMRVTLRPATLGDIVLRVLTQNGIVTAQFVAESQRVREALESGFNQLRDALQEQGIQFSELSVSVRQDANEQMNQFEQARRQGQNRAESIAETLTTAQAESIESIDFDNTINLTA